MTVLITGATGLIGQEIVKQCHAQGINVHYLTTSKSKLSTEANYKGFYWNPDKNEIDHNCFKDVSAIINLVGASISKRWTDAYKKEILESRTKTAQLLQETIKTHQYNIDQVVSASAIGIYPTSLTNYYDEDHKQISESFLGKVVDQWESAVDGFKTATGLPDFSALPAISGFASGFFVSDIVFAFVRKGMTLFVSIRSYPLEFVRSLP